jgi:cation/acetate symporter
LAASSLFVPLVAGIFWSNATRRGAMWAMGTGFFSSAVYLAISNAGFMASLNLNPVSLFGISGVASGVITVPLSALGMVLGSIWGGPKREMVDMIVTLRTPEQPFDSSKV